MRFFTAFALAMLFCVGCLFSVGHAADVTIGKRAVPVPQEISPEGRALVQEYVPRLAAVCPGFEKYGESFEDMRFGDYSSEGIDLVFRASDKNNIPAEYFASGHRCPFYITWDEATLSIAKRPCQAVCLDRNRKGGATYVELPLP